ncbi:MAG: hypothetical protein HY646_16350 [Acidobacteria bacterium]|nr:hypothetical protein [Acidobacteriota bacterium]
MRILLVVAAVIANAAFGFVGEAEASECFDQLLSDTAACLATRDTCIAETSWWTRTCTIEYFFCELGAELAYADCVYVGI